MHVHETTFCSYAGVATLTGRTEGSFDALTNTTPFVVQALSRRFLFYQYAGVMK